MTSCERARQLYSICLEGEASVSDRHSLERHLETCAACRADHAVFVRTTELLRGLPRVDVSPGFEDRVLALARAAEQDSAMAASRPVEIRIEPVWWQAWIPRLVLAGAAALVVVVSLNVLGVGHGRKTVDSAAGKPAATAPAAVVSSAGRELASGRETITSLEQLIPDLPPEVLESVRSLDKEGVLDQMVIRPGTPQRGFQVVAPVDHEPSGTVYVTF